MKIFHSLTMHHSLRCHQISETTFEDAAALATAYAPASALFLHLGLERMPQNQASVGDESKNVLIWGASSSFGAIAAQMASLAGYRVVGVASARNAGLVKSLGAGIHFIDRSSLSVVADL